MLPNLKNENEDVLSKYKGRMYYQSRISKIFGLPSEVICRSAAAGSTPVSAPHRKNVFFFLKKKAQFIVEQ